jgi:hypothetical protein
MKKISFWNADKFVSFSAILISLLSLYITIEQHNANKEQQRLSVLPYLSFGNYGTWGDNYTYMISNNGIGPAFIDSVIVHYQGKVFQGDLMLFLNTYFRDKIDSIPGMSHSNIYRGMMIPAGEKIEHLRVHNNQKSGKMLLELLMSLGEQELEYEIFYSSIYKERWRLRASETVVEKIE